MNVKIDFIRSGFEKDSKLNFAFFFYHHDRESKNLNLGLFQKINDLLSFCLKVFSELLGVPYTTKESYRKMVNQRGILYILVGKVTTIEKTWTNSCFSHIKFNIKNSLQLNLRNVSTEVVGALVQFNIFHALSFR